MIQGEPRKPLRVGTVVTINAETGKVTDERHNAAMLMPPGPDVCQECAVDHPHDLPHNQQSIHYQMAFHATHGRWATWTDAMIHCTPEVQAQWRTALVALLRSNGQPIPDDLLDPEPAGR